MYACISVVNYMRSPKLNINFLLRNTEIIINFYSTQHEYLLILHTIIVWYNRFKMINYNVV